MTMRLLLLAFGLFLGISAVGFEVQAGSTECFWEEAKKSSAITVIFQVTHGGYLDIDVEVDLLSEENILKFSALFA